MNVVKHFKNWKKCDIMEKVGRNDPCPCGSGKKYKKCCLDKKELIDNSSMLENDNKSFEETLEEAYFFAEPGDEILTFFGDVEDIPPIIKYENSNLLADTWRAINALTPFDKKFVFETILTGVSPIEAYNLQQFQIRMQEPDSLPTKVRKGEVPAPESVLEEVAELEKRLKGNNII
jgi:hypothetical protein